MGGGKTERIRTKSMPAEKFQNVMKQIPHAKYISLQYGSCNKQIEAWQHQGIDITFDSDIDPIKDMDKWMAQVACCNAVISVANTTIHGAGGLNKPTLCLQSRTTDWRWIDGLNHSYWYESVDAISQTRDGDWDEAISQVSQWSSKVLSNEPTDILKKDERQQACINAMTFK